MLCFGSSENLVEQAEMPQTSKVESLDTPVSMSEKPQIKKVERPLRKVSPKLAHQIIYNCIIVENILVHADIAEIPDLMQVHPFWETSALRAGSALSKLTKEELVEFWMRNIETGQARVVRLLVDRGFVKASVRKSKAAWRLVEAAREKAQDSTRMNVYVNILRFLLSHNRFQPSANSNRALFIAYEAGLDDIVSVLLDDVRVYRGGDMKKFAQMALKKEDLSLLSKLVQYPLLKDRYYHVLSILEVAIRHDRADVIDKMSPDMLRFAYRPARNCIHYLLWHQGWSTLLALLRHHSLWPQDELENLICTAVMASLHRFIAFLQAFGDTDEIYILLHKCMQALFSRRSRFILHMYLHFPELSLSRIFRTYLTEILEANDMIEIERVQTVLQCTSSELLEIFSMNAVYAKDARALSISLFVTSRPLARHRDLYESWCQRFKMSR